MNTASSATRRQRESDDIRFNGGNARDRIGSDFTNSSDTDGRRKPRNIGEAENKPYMDKAMSNNTDISLESLEGTSYLLKEKTNSVRP